MSAALSQPMDTDGSGKFWQDIPEMTANETTRLAGIVGAAELLAIWNFNAARVAGAIHRQGREHGGALRAGDRIRAGLYARRVASRANTRIDNLSEGGAL